MRVCKECGKELPLEQFAKIASCEGGRGRTCKNCYNAYQRRQNAKRRERRAANPPDLESLRVCRGCDEEKPLARFTRGVTGRDGYTSTCRDCYNARIRERTAKGV